MHMLGQRRDGFRASAHCAVLAAIFFGAGAYAADVSVVIVDGEGHPVVDAVIALIPQSAAAMEINSTRPDKSIDQVDKQFRPTVLAFQSGTLVYFPNSDNIRHQVYSFSDAKKFETKLYSGRTAAPVLFDKPGVVVLGCNIHDSMLAYLYVLDTPYFAKTDGAGSAVLSAPTALYTVRIWHPRYKNGRISLSHDFTLANPQESIHETLALDNNAGVATTPPVKSP